MQFGSKHILPEEITGKAVLEVGSRNINGSLRSVVEKYSPSKYVGIDIQAGKGVDVVCGIENALSVFGKESFDCVISTDAIEHIKQWRTAITNMKELCACNGVILITTVRPGFQKHDYPSDYWRFTKKDLKELFSDCHINALYRDSRYNVGIKATKPATFVRRDISNYTIKHIDEVTRKTIVYYTDNTFKLADVVRDNLLRMGIPIISVSHRPLDFGKNIVVGDIGRSFESIYKQILTGIENAKNGVIYLCEHDNIYHRSHFDFIPARTDTFYYNSNRWRLRLDDGKASYYDGIQAVSQLVAFKKVLLRHYRERQKRKFKYHEPGLDRGYRYEEFASEYPNIDIRHKGTITGGDKFTSNKGKRRNFVLADEIPFWGRTYGCMGEFINGLRDNGKRERLQLSSA